MLDAPSDRFFAFRRDNLYAWEAAITQLFPAAIPDSSAWNDRAAIVRVLQRLARPHGLCHVYLPSGGGLDLNGASDSSEPDCIELHLEELCVRVRPLQLLFESLGDEYEWAYFRLETCSEPGGNAEAHEDRRDLGLVLEPFAAVPMPPTVSSGPSARRTPAAASHNGRIIDRFNSGAFAFFAKGSLYNWTTRLCETRHNDMTSHEFASYLRELQERYQ